MTEQEKEQLKLEINHIFESGANEIRIFEMVVNFIDSRNGVNKNFVLADVSSLLKAEREATKDEIREWLIAEDFEGLAEHL
jgi:hypothetical protein